MNRQNCIIENCQNLAMKTGKRKDGSQKYKQIGNAVPIKLATAIGKEIIKTWERNKNDH